MPGVSGKRSINPPEHKCHGRRSIMVEIDKWMRTMCERTRDEFGARMLFFGIAGQLSARRGH